MLGGDAVPAEDDDAVADGQGLVDVVGDEDDRAAGRLPRLDQQALHGGAGLGVEGAERLVHADHAGRAGQGAGELDPLPHAAGELAGQPLGVPAQPDPRQPLVGAAPALGAADALEVERQLDVAPGGAPRQQRVVLEDQGPVGAGAGDLLAVGDHLAADRASSPARARSSVDLPQPEGPSTTRISPGATSRSRCSTTGSSA